MTNEFYWNMRVYKAIISFQYVLTISLKDIYKEFLIIAIVLGYFVFLSCFKNNLLASNSHLTLLWHYFCLKHVTDTVGLCVNLKKNKDMNVLMNAR